MSPVCKTHLTGFLSGPRASGDEPGTIDEGTGDYRWSPRERG